MWNLVDSNHVNRIFSPAHIPYLPKFLLSGDGRIRTAVQTMQPFVFYMFSYVLFLDELCK